MADGFILNDSDRQKIVDLVVAEAQRRINSVDQDSGRVTKMSPEMYISRGPVPRREGLCAGTAILPIYKLEREGGPLSDEPWCIEPVILPGGNQKEQEVFNVRCCDIIDEYNYINRDSFGRYHIQYHPCICSSSSSSSSSSASSSSFSSESSSSKSKSSSSVSESSVSVLSSSVGISSVSAPSEVCIRIPGVDAGDIPAGSIDNVAGVLAYDNNGCLVLLPITDCEGEITDGGVVGSVAPPPAVGPPVAFLFDSDGNPIVLDNGVPVGVA